MASMTEITCVCGCKRKRMARTADVNRGWGKYFSKSCKAKAQEKRTGQYADLIHGDKRQRKVIHGDKRQRKVARRGIDLLSRLSTAGVYCIDDNFYSENDIDESDGSWDAHKS